MPPLSRGEASVKSVTSERGDELRRTQTHLEQIAKNEKFRDVASFFAGCTYVHLIPQLIRRPEYFFNPTADQNDREYSQCRSACRRRHHG